jgi:isopentenyl-diphosphate delta-isomerase type 1
MKRVASCGAEKFVCAVVLTVICSLCKSSEAFITNVATTRPFYSAFGTVVAKRGGDSTLMSAVVDNDTSSSSQSSSTSDSAPVQSAVYGQGMDQTAMMEQDCIVAVDEYDRVIPNDKLASALGDESIQFLSKKQAHLFTAEQPRGIAHRAFSVFLFNCDNEMLLTKRASDKITFPNVWTNTCCSHPIYGQTPNEVDDGVAGYPHFPGIKHAAIRKLHHELGIVAQDVPHSQFRFVSRFHYWAADTLTYSKEEPQWGEHEVDYVLFLKYPEKEIPLQVNAEEVGEYKYVSANELKQMFAESSDTETPPESTSILWSPWFRGIMEKGGYEWWDHLDEIVSSADEAHCQFTTSKVTFFSPPPQHHAVFNHDDTHSRQTGVLQQ